MTWKMASKRTTSPAQRLVLGCRRQAEQRLTTLGLPSGWPACLDLLDTHQVPETDNSGRSLFYSRKGVIDTARLLYQTYCVEHWLKENDAERATASMLDLLDLALTAGLTDAIDSEHAASTQTRRQQIKRGDLRWWRRVATALRKQNGTLSNLEIARRIDPRRHHTIRKYL
jgi:hypothetical protein